MHFLVHHPSPSPLPLPTHLLPPAISPHTPPPLTGLSPTAHPHPPYSSTLGHTETKPSSPTSPSDSPSIFYSAARSGLLWASGCGQWTRADCRPGLPSQVSVSRQAGARGWSWASCWKDFLFVVSLGLHCCMWSLSSCRERGYSLVGCMGFSCCRAWTLHAWALVAGVHGLSHSTACGILPNQGLNLCLLHRQADSYPLYHQGSPGGSCS